MTDHNFPVVAGVKVMCCVDNPGAIKLQTIKRKYLEQIPKRSREELAEHVLSVEDCEVLGVAEGHVVFVDSDGKLFRAHNTDWRLWLGLGCDDLAKANAIIRDQMDSYPQLFAD